MWLGLYIIKHIVAKRAYKLVDLMEFPSRDPEMGCTSKSTMRRTFLRSHYVCTI